MSNVPFLNLPAVTGLNGSEIIPCVQVGVTSRMNVFQITQFVATQDLNFNPGDLPVTLPPIAGIVWNNGGVVSIS